MLTRVSGGWRWRALSILAAAGLATAAAGQSGSPSVDPGPPLAQDDAGPLPDDSTQIVPDPDTSDDGDSPEQTEALPDNPDDSAPEQLVEPAPPEPGQPEVIQPATPDVAVPAAPQPILPKNSIGALPDADPGRLPDGDKAVDTPSAAGVEPLRLGVLPSGDPAGTIAALQPLATRLSDKLGRPVEILPMASYRVMVDAQTLQRIDGALFSASAYAAADAMCDCLEPLVAPASDDGSLAYQALIVARPESGITAVAGLQGKIVATAEPSSIGGRRMQLAGLMAEGFDLKGFFARIRTMPSATDAVRLVLNGGADAAFAWTSVVDGTTSTGEGTLPILGATGELAPGALGIVWRSPPIEHGPFAVAKTLPDDVKSAIRDALVALATDNPEAYDALSPVYGGGFVAVEPSAYRGVALLAQQNIDAALPRAAVEPPVPRLEPQAVASQPQ